MSITNNNTIAKIAAVIAGLGLVAMSFATFAPAKAADASDTQAQIATLLAQIESLKAQLGTSSSAAAVTFSKDLTLGASGADVTALQNWLIAKGYSVPAGATGYFGAQTQAAVAAFQTANGITPASGYFGPITRAKVNAMGSVSTGSTGGSTSTSTGDLKGGEANLTHFDMASGDGSGSEGESDVEIGTASFDVEDGDVNVQRAKLTFEYDGTDAGSANPWKYFDSISLYADGKKLASVDANSKSDWDKDSTDIYTITVSGLNYKVAEGDTAEIVIKADIASSMDSDDVDYGKFKVSVATDDIRALDAAGIQQYTGDDSDTVSFSFDGEENGDLSVRDSSEDPDASTLKVESNKTSDEYTVFAFDLRNKDDADSDLTDLIIHATSSATGEALSDIVSKATVTIDGKAYSADIVDSGTNGDGTIELTDEDITIDANSTVTVSLAVKFAGDSAYASDLPITMYFGVVGNDDISAEGVDSGDAATVSGEQESETHTVAETGFAVAANTSSVTVTSKDTTDDSYGTFKVKFDVTADEDDAIYIAKSAASAATSSASTGVIYHIVDGNGDVVLTGDSESASVSATNATTVGSTYKVNAGDTATFTLTVTYNPADAGQYAVELYQVDYGTDSSAAHSATYTVDTDNDDFQTDTEYIES